MIFSQSVRGRRLKLESRVVQRPPAGSLEEQKGCQQGRMSYEKILTRDLIAVETMNRNKAVFPQRKEGTRQTPAGALEYKNRPASVHLHGSRGRSPVSVSPPVNRRWRFRSWLRSSDSWYPERRWQPLASRGLLTAKEPETTLDRSTHYFFEG